MKKLIVLIFLLQISGIGFSQILEPVKWSFSSEKINDKEAEVLLKATIDPGWHIYSQFLKDGGPVPTSFKFKADASYKLIGKVAEPKAKITYEKVFEMDVAYHEKEVIFRQRIQLNVPSAIVSGTLEFMVCNDEKCLPPSEIEFKIPVNSTNSKPDLAATISESPQSLDSQAINIKPKESSVPQYSSSKAVTETDGSGTLWGIFVAGFLGGLAAFFMPCIYPMIPLTISYFTKKSGSRAKGIQSAFIYGISIIIIYVALGLLVTVIFGASALNEAASSATFNLLFFVVLVVFAISFLGAFEITLPSSLVNKADEKSNSGGLIGLFFMAFTLSLVSFSCTGPIIGYLLVDAVSKGTYLGPATGMFGFSLALAIPFTLFAIFPSWLKELPKSGGWLNTVKVSLGFLELALAFKFISNVDLAYHWGIFNRDVFLVIWIVIFGLLALYLLGKIRLSHDSEPGYLSLPRLFFAMAALGFTIYMIPGLWGAELQGISAWLPPQTASSFNISGGTAKAGTGIKDKKYAGLFHTPHGLDAFYDYDEGLAYAKQVNKPVLLDFTGWSCTNCRKMEASVWSDPQVLKRLKENYVLISLYVDDKTELPANEQYLSTSGKKITKIGQKWSDLQTTRFETNSQPYYVITDDAGQPLQPAQAFNLDINNYLQFLDSGRTKFSSR